MYRAKRPPESGHCNAADCNVVLIGTPIDLARMLKINKPAVRVTYELQERNPGQLEAPIRKVVG